MPSIEQCETATRNLATLSSTLEIFDKFKSTSDNGKDSDSEESFHLVYDEDENQSVISNGKEKESPFEESEEDILNKFDTAHSGTPDNLDSAIEDSLLNEADFSSETKVLNNSSLEKSSCIDTVIHIDVNIQEDGYERFENGEFKSAYEDDPELQVNEQETTTEPMDTSGFEEEKNNEFLDTYEDSMEVEQDIIASKDIENIIETLDKPSDAVTEDIEPCQENSNEDVQVNETDDVNLNENLAEEAEEELNDKIEDSKLSVSESEALVEPVNLEEKTETHVEQTSTVRTRSMRKKECKKQSSDVQEEIKEKEEGKVENNTTTETELIDEDNQRDSSLLIPENSSDKSASILEDKVLEKDVFKMPLEVSKLEGPLNQPETKEGPDLQNEKSNDKTDDDESDLLDISMIRETEEDDACAIADAIEDNEISERDKDGQTSEKSDEEQSEKVDTEQEGSEGDEREEDNEQDNEQLGFEEDADSPMDITENDSSNIEAAESDKNNEVADNLKESTTVDSDTQMSTDQLETNKTATVECEENTSGLIISDVQESTDINSSQDNECAVSENCENFSVEEISNEKTEAAVQDELVSDTDKTDKDSDKSNNECKPIYPQAIPLPDVPKATENSSDQQKGSKRPHTEHDLVDSTPSSKKAKLNETENEMPNDSCEVPSRKSQEIFSINEKIQTLTSFSKFMQSRKLTNKLSRSDLEQLCIQKICECLVLKSKEGEMYQTIKQQQRTIDNLRKDLQQVGKQSKDLEIVHKKLISELKKENPTNKPLLPLKITRSVGLQVRLNPVNETQIPPRRRPSTSTTPQKQPILAANNATKSPSTANRSKTTPTAQAQQHAVVRQIGQTSPQKSPLTTAQTTTNNTQTSNTLLSQALQPKPRHSTTPAKRTTLSPQIRKVAEAAKPNNPGVIDLTDEDDRLAAAKTGNAVKIVNKPNTAPNTSHKVTHKIIPGKTVLAQGKQVGLQKATVTVGANKAGTLSPGIRLTPASVITSSANGSPQMVYVVPTTINSGGTQKVALLNFQPTNGVISGTLGQTVSVMSNKQGQTLTLKTMSAPVRTKHPAPLPAPPRINLDSKLKALLPKPHLTIKKIDTGIILQWKMPYNLDLYESIASYQLYAYQETSAPPSTDMWRKVGDVKALALPMACTLTQFADKNKYYFAVRSVDVYKRIGAFSDPEQISL